MKKYANKLEVTKHGNKIEINKKQVKDGAHGIIIICRMKINSKEFAIYSFLIASGL